MDIEKQTRMAAAAYVAGLCTELVSNIVYGDIERSSLANLGKDCPTIEEYRKMDVEQQTRLAAAAYVAEYFAKTTEKLEKD